MGRGGHGPPERQGQPCSRAPWGCWASLSRPDSTLGGHFCVSKHRSASQAAAVLHAPDNKAGPCGSAWGRQRTALPTSPQKAAREEARPAGKGAARASWQPELWRGPSPWLSPRRALCGRRTCHGPCSGGGLSTEGRGRGVSAGQFPAPRPRATVTESLKSVSPWDLRSHYYHPSLGINRLKFRERHSWRRLTGPAKGSGHRVPPAR